MNAKVSLFHILTILIVVAGIAIALSNRLNTVNNSRPCNTTSNVVRNVSGESTFTGKEARYAGD